MSLSEIENQEELNQELKQLANQVENEANHDRRKAMIGWITSGCLHAISLMIVSSIYFIAVDVEEELPPVKVGMVAIPLTKKPDDFINDFNILKNDVTIETEEFDPEAKVNISNLELPVDVVNSSDDDMTPSDLKKGREEAVSASEMGGPAFFNNIGVGGGAGGMFGNRKGGGDKRTRMKMGPMGKPATAATDAGLRWLKKHQSPVGLWDAQSYFQICTDAIKCEPGSYEGHAPEQVNVAMTGYAALCFLGGGYDHKSPSKYRPVIAKAIEYLVAVQKPNGMLGDRNYEHAVATMALVEAYGMSNDPKLRKPGQLAVDALIARQGMGNKDDPYSGLLWDYSKPNATRQDLSITGWNIMALKSAHAAGFDVKDSITGAKNSIEKCWKAANPDWEKKTDPYNDITIFPYTWNTITNETKKDHLSFVGSTCAVFLGHKSGDIMLETLLNDADNRWIKTGAYKKNTYACYYLSLSMFQAGGERWQSCLKTIIPYTLEGQSKIEDCTNGSWAWEGQGWHGAKIGRVLTTTYNILNLQVAYRYAQVNGGIEKVLKK